MADITLGIDGRCFVGPAAGTTHYVRELGLALQGGLNAPQVLVYDKRPCSCRHRKAGTLGLKVTQCGEGCPRRFGIAGAQVAWLHKMVSPYF